MRANLPGMVSIASSTSSRNSSRSSLRLSESASLPDVFRPELAGLVWNPVRIAEVAIRTDVASRAERLRPADAAAMQDQRVRRARPSLGRQQFAELPPRPSPDRPCFTRPMRLATRKHVAIDRQARDAQRVAEHDVRGLAADAGQLRRVRPCRRAPGRHARRPAGSPCRSATSTSAGRSRSSESASRVRPSRPSPAPARRDTARTAPASTRLTRASVDCADRMVATSSSKALR